MTKKKISFSKQFRGKVPRQPTDPDSPLNSPEPESPEAQRKRSSVAKGFQSQARPGLVGMQDRSRKPKRKK